MQLLETMYILGSNLNFSRVITHYFSLIYVSEVIFEIYFPGAT